MQSIHNHERDEHHYMIARWFTEFALVPLHFLASVHLYTLATCIGVATITFFIIVSIRYRPQVVVPVETVDESASGRQIVEEKF